MGELLKKRCADCPRPVHDRTRDGWVIWPTLLVAFTLAGSGIGLAETAESTLVARALPDELRGSGFGLLGGVQAAGDFASSAVVGLLYAVLSPVIGFAYAAGWMLVALLGSAHLRATREGGAI